MKVAPVRDVEVADLPRMLEIERAAFPSPWSGPMFALEMSQRDNEALGIEVDGRLTGYVLCTPHDGVWHLVNLAIDLERRRSGLASRLMEELIERVGPRAPITLEVRPTNRPALELYGKHGFLVAGRRRAYYADNGEDALVMWRTAATLAGSLEGIPNADPEAG